jgi:tetratricopeptide (TPR) repeat protein
MFSQDFWKKLREIGLVILITLACVVVCFILVVFFKLFILFPYQNYYGLNFRGASNKYYTAMCEGNGESAVIWAKKLYDIAQKDTGDFSDYRYKTNIGYAYELNGENEKALEIYTQFVRKDDFDHNNFCHDIIRIYYKLGQREKAFREYCNYANWCRNKYANSLKSNVWYERNQTLDKICSRIITIQEHNLKQLTAFIDYCDFLDFMEDEYTKLGSPPEYEEAMQLFHAVQNKINEEKLSHGLNFNEAYKKYCTAMCEGNGKEALIWANTFCNIRRKEKYHGNGQDEKYIGYASELNGEYGKAIEIYTRFVIVSDPFEHNNFRLDIIRVHYKRGQRKKAFQEYCDYANWCLNKYTDLKSSNVEEKNQILDTICSRITTVKEYSYLKQLTIFIDYSNFLDFMEEEYTKLGSPPEYDKAMQLFRTIQNEIQ